MSRIILLDSAPLGLIARRRPQPEVIRWVTRLTDGGAHLAIAAVIDYELRRELVRSKLADSLHALDGLHEIFEYLPIDDRVWHLAAQMWATVRSGGKPTADPNALDIDVLLAAQAQLLLDAGNEVVVATTNVKHLALFVPARLWNEII